MCLLVSFSYKYLVDSKGYNKEIVLLYQYDEYWYLNKLY